MTNDRPWRLAELSFIPSGNGRERATINGVEVVRENGRYWIITPNGPLWSNIDERGGRSCPELSVREAKTGAAVGSIKRRRKGALKEMAETLLVAAALAVLAAATVFMMVELLQRAS